MFGYVTLYKPEIRMKDWERYNAYYCGVCKSIGARFGQFPRTLLSFDAAFFALALAGLSDDESLCAVSRERCAAHPVKQKLIVREPAIDYAADVMLLLAYYKMKDDKQDEHSLKAAAGERYLRGAMRKIRKAHPVLCAVTEEQVKRQAELESQRCDSVDLAADPTGRIIEAVLTEGQKCIAGASADRAATEAVGAKTAGETAAERVLAQFGYQLGRFIYLIDAADDITADIASGGYNPFKERFRYNASGETGKAFSRRVRGDAERILLSCLADMANSFDLLEMKRNADIIENVIRCGLLKRTDEVLKKLEGNNQ